MWHGTMIWEHDYVCGFVIMLHLCWLFLRKEQGWRNDYMRIHDFVD